MSGRPSARRWRAMRMPACRPRNLHTSGRRIRSARRAIGRYGRRWRSGSSLITAIERRSWLSGLVDREKVIGGGVAQRVEESAAAARVAPALGINTLGVAAHIEKVGPRLIVEQVRLQ